MSILNPPEISSAHFTYMEEGKTFTTFISDLKGANPHFDLGRVYDDACDVGFTLVSVKTGQRVVFAHVFEVKSEDGEIQGSRFDAVTPGFRGYHAVIFND